MEVPSDKSRKRPSVQFVADAITLASDNTNTTQQQPSITSSSPSVYHTNASASSVLGQRTAEYVRKQQQQQQICSSTTTNTTPAAAKAVRAFAKVDDVIQRLADENVNSAARLEQLRADSIAAHTNTSSSHGTTRHNSVINGTTTAAAAERRRTNPTTTTSPMRGGRQATRSAITAVVVTPTEASLAPPTTMMRNPQPPNQPRGSVTSTTTSPVRGGARSASIATTTAGGLVGGGGGSPSKVRPKGFSPITPPLPSLTIINEPNTINTAAGPMSTFAARQQQGASPEYVRVASMAIAAAEAEQIRQKIEEVAKERDEQRRRSRSKSLLEVTEGAISSDGPTARIALDGPATAINEDPLTTTDLGEDADDDDTDGEMMMGGVGGPLPSAAEIKSQIERTFREKAKHRRNIAMAARAAKLKHLDECPRCARRYKMGLAFAEQRAKERVARDAGGVRQVTTPRSRPASEPCSGSSKRTTPQKNSHSGGNNTSDEADYSSCDEHQRIMRMYENINGGGDGRFSSGGGSVFRGVPQKGYPRTSPAGGKGGKDSPDSCCGGHHSRQSYNTDGGPNGLQFPHLMHTANDLPTDPNGRPSTTSAATFYDRYGNRHRLLTTDERLERAARRRQNHKTNYTCCNRMGCAGYMGECGGVYYIDANGKRHAHCPHRRRRHYTGTPTSQRRGGGGSDDDASVASHSSDGIDEDDHRRRFPHLNEKRQRDAMWHRVTLSTANSNKRSYSSDNSSYQRALGINRGTFGTSKRFSYVEDREYNVGHPRKVVEPPPRNIRRSAGGRRSSPSGNSDNDSGASWVDDTPFGGGRRFVSAPRDQYTRKRPYQSNAGGGGSYDDGRMATDTYEEKKPFRKGPSMDAGGGKRRTTTGDGFGSSDDEDSNDAWNGNTATKSTKFAGPRDFSGRKSDFGYGKGGGLNTALDPQGKGGRGTSIFGNSGRHSDSTSTNNRHSTSNGGDSRRRSPSGSSLSGGGNSRRLTTGAHERRLSKTLKQHTSEFEKIKQQREARLLRKQQAKEKEAADLLAQQEAEAEAERLAKIAAQEAWEAEQAEIHLREQYDRRHTMHMYQTKGEDQRVHRQELDKKFAVLSVQLDGLEERNRTALDEMEELIAAKKAQLEASIAATNQARAAADGARKLILACGDESEALLRDIRAARVDQIENFIGKGTTALMPSLQELLIRVDAAENNDNGGGGGSSTPTSPTQQSQQQRKSPLRGEFEDIDGTEVFGTGGGNDKSRSHRSTSPSSRRRGTTTTTTTKSSQKWALISTPIADIAAEINSKYVVGAEQQQQASAAADNNNFGDSNDDNPLFSGSGGFGGVNDGRHASVDGSSSVDGAPFARGGGVRPTLSIGSSTNIGSSAGSSGAVSPTRSRTTPRNNNTTNTTTANNSNGNMANKGSHPLPHHRTAQQKKCLRQGHEWALAFLEAADIVAVAAGKCPLCIHDDEEVAYNAAVAAPTNTTTTTATSHPHNNNNTTTHHGEPSNNNDDSGSDDSNKSPLTFAFLDNNDTTAAGNKTATTATIIKRNGHDNNPYDEDYSTDSSVGADASAALAQNRNGTDTYEDEEVETDPNNVTAKTIAPTPPNAAGSKNPNANLLGIACPTTTATRDSSSSLINMISAGQAPPHQFGAGRGLGGGQSPTAAALHAGIDPQYVYGYDNDNNGSGGNTTMSPITSARRRSARRQRRRAQSVSSHNNSVTSSVGSTALTVGPSSSHPAAIGPPPTRDEIEQRVGDIIAAALHTNLLKTSPAAATADVDNGGGGDIDKTPSQQLTSVNALANDMLAPYRQQVLRALVFEAARSRDAFERWKLIGEDAAHNAHAVSAAAEESRKLSVAVERDNRLRRDLGLGPLPAVTDDVLAEANAAKVAAMLRPSGVNVDGVLNAVIIAAPPSSPSPPTTTDNNNKVSTLIQAVRTVNKTIKDGNDDLVRYGCASGTVVGAGMGMGGGGTTTTSTAHSSSTPLQPSFLTDGRKTIRNTDRGIWFDDDEQDEEDRKVAAMSKAAVAAAVADAKRKVIGNPTDTNNTRPATATVAASTAKAATSTTMTATTHRHRPPSPPRGPSAAKYVHLYHVVNKVGGSTTSNSMRGATEVRQTYPPPRPTDETAPEAGIVVLNNGAPRRSEVTTKTLTRHPQPPPAATGGGNAAFSPSTSTINSAATVNSTTTRRPIPLLIREEPLVVYDTQQRLGKLSSVRRDGGNGGGGASNADNAPAAHPRVTTSGTSTAPLAAELTSAGSGVPSTTSTIRSMLDAAANDGGKKKGINVLRAVLDA